MPDATIILSAFSEDHVERLTGITKARLRYWDRTGFFSPAYGDQNRRVAFSRIYSFKDVVALRTINKLRTDYAVPLQHLRKVAEKLNHLAIDLWTRTTLYVLGKRVLFQEPGTERPQEVLTGQFEMGIELRAIVSDTKRDAERLLKRSSQKLGQIERSRYINHNAWVIAGTRIPTAAIRRYKEAGYTLDQIIKEYPDLARQDVEAALAHEERVAAAA